MSPLILDADEFYHVTLKHHDRKWPHLSQNIVIIAICNIVCFGTLESCFKYCHINVHSFFLSLVFIFHIIKHLQLHLQLYSITEC